MHHYIDFHYHHQSLPLPPLLTSIIKTTHNSITSHHIFNPHHHSPIPPLSLPHPPLTFIISTISIHHILPSSPLLYYHFVHYHFFSILPLLTTIIFQQYLPLHYFNYDQRMIVFENSCL